MTSRAAIDSNVLADWIALSEYLKEKSKEEHPTILKNMERENPRLVNSYSFIEKICEREFEEFNFIVSPLGLIEISNALIKKAIYEQMYRHGIPFEDFPSYKHSPSIKENDLQILIDASHQHIERLKDLVNVVEVSVEDSKVSIKKSRELLIKLRLRTQDAVLLGEAIAVGATHFITNDKHLIEESKKAKLSSILLIKPAAFSLSFMKK